MRSSLSRLCPTFRLKKERSAWISAAQHATMYATILLFGWYLDFMDSWPSLKIWVAWCYPLFHFINYGQFIFVKWQLNARFRTFNAQKWIQHKKKIALVTCGQILRSSNLQIMILRYQTDQKTGFWPGKSGFWFSPTTAFDFYTWERSFLKFTAF